MNRVRRIGNYGIKRLIAPVFWIHKRVAVSNIKMIVVDVVQKHVDTAEVVGSEIDFLPKETLTNIFFTKDFSELKEQRARTAGWIVDLIHFCFAYGSDFRQKFADFLRRKKVPTFFTSIRCIHSQQIFISITKN